jgi:hypothetical protein
MGIVKTIGVAADEIILELGYFSSEKKIFRQSVIVRMDVVRSELLSNLAYYGIYIGNGYRYQIDNNLTNLPDIYYISRTADVLFDNDRKRYYSDMPSEYVSFNNVNGIRQIKPIQANEGGYFWSQRNGASSAFGELESSLLAGAVGFEIEGQQVFYNNMPNNAYSSVLITYMPALSGLKETDVMPCSAEIQNIVMEKTREYFMLQRQIPENKTTDSSSE